MSSLRVADTNGEFEQKIQVHIVIFEGFQAFDGLQLSDILYLVPKL